MKRNKLTGMLLILLAAVFIAGTGITPVKADHGPKPSIEVTVKNAPAYKYVTILEKEKVSASNNRVLKVENLETEAVRDYLKNFSYDGYKTYVLISDIELREHGQGDTYSFGYFVPNPFKVLVIADDGTVYISPELAQKEYNCETEYDVKAGTLTENLAGKTAKRIVYILCCFVLTIGLELLIFMLFRYPFTKPNLICFFAINIITQLGLNIFLAYSNGGYGMLGIYTAVEIVIAVVEGIFFANTLKDSLGYKSKAKGFMFGIVANLFSYAAGFLISYLVRGVWTLL